MVVPTTDYQVRCILWVQVDIFNIGIGFLCEWKFFDIESILWSLLTIKFLFGVATMIKKKTVKMCQ